ncbi:MAG: hypothetical protein LCH61_01850, partial [Proteobacteria bacterium]|nr:hypothetical protein [Pseudomonadota bacterium]
MPPAPEPIAGGETDGGDALDATTPGKIVSISIEGQAPFQGRVVRKDAEGITVVETDGTETTISNDDISEGRISVSPKERSLSSVPPASGGNDGATSVDATEAARLVPPSAPTPSSDVMRSEAIYRRAPGEVPAKPDAASQDFPAYISATLGTRKWAIISPRHRNAGDYEAHLTQKRYQEIKDRYERERAEVTPPISNADGISQPGSRQSVAPGSAAPQPASIADPKKSPAQAAFSALPKTATAKARRDARKAAVIDFFTPGNIVRGYGGSDRVLDFKLTGDGGFAARVESVVKQAGEWVKNPADMRVRTHATMPTDRELIAGPIERPATPLGAAKSEPDALGDGRASSENFLAASAALRAELKAAVTEAVPLRKSTDLTEKAPGADLERRLAAATSSEERQKVAADFTLERGRQTGNEHLVFLGPDGALISLTEGDPKGVEFPDAAHQAVVTGKASFSVHNHPGNRGPSSADIGNLFGGVDPMVIVGHDGARHEMRRSEAAKILKPADAIRAYKALEAWLAQLWRRDQGGVSPDALNQQFHNVIVVTMERLGLIEYDGTAATDIKANGIETDDLLPFLFSAVAPGLRRSGYSVPESGDRGGNRRAGADAAQPGAESAPRDPSGLPEGGNGRGRVPAQGLKPAPKTDKLSSGNAAIDSALDDIFGDEADVPSPGQRVERDSGNPDPADGMGGTDVPAAAGRDGRGGKGRTGPGGSPDGEQGAGGGLPGGDAPPVGSGSDQGMDRAERPARKPAAGRKRGAGDGNRAGGLPPDTGRGADPAGDASGAAAGKLTPAQQLAAIRGIFKEDVIDFVMGPERRRTDSDAFRKWFGDSKVVDADGEPLVVYHGTNENFEVFDPARLGDSTGADSAKMGFFFAKSADVAASYAVTASPYRGGILDIWNKITGGLYERINEAAIRGLNRIGVLDRASAYPTGGNVIPAYLSVQNPMIADFKGAEYREESFASIIARAKASGHDGVILRDTVDEGFEVGGDGVTDVFVAFDPTQIKSIFNQGTWDASSPYMLREDAANPIDPRKSEALESIFLGALDGVNVKAASDRELFRSIILPLRDAGMTREEVAELTPYLESFLANLRAGRVGLTPEPTPRAIEADDRAAVQAKPTVSFAEDGDPFGDGAFAAQIMQELAQVDDLFQNPRSAGTTLKTVFADIDPSITIGGRLAKDDPRAEDKDADEVFFGQTAKGKPFYVMQTGKEVWIDVSDLSQGDGGNAIYSAISDYALNTGKVFVGDPAGLSFKALRRRTDNMLSTALKHGTTRHIEPHPDQVAGHPDHGIPGLRWTDGDDAGNLSSLIEVSIANLTSLVPEVADARYDFQTGTFRTGEGQPLSDVALDGWVSAAGRSGAARIGRATLKRGILLNTLAQSESGERPGILARSLRQSRQLVTRGGLRRTFYQASHPIVKDADAATDRIAAMMPKLRAELDRLDLKRVKLAMDSGSDWQGMFQVTGDGAMEITIAASLDPMKTLHHEVIHALRSLDLFTLSEWRALELAAERGWIEKHDIAARYPDLLPHEQIEEAIAEEFSEALAVKKSPKGSALVTAFNKIARLLRALRNVLNGAGYQTAEDIFGRILAGEISKRQAGSHKGQIVAGQHKQRKREASFSPTALDRIRNANAAYGAPQGPLELPVPEGYDLPKRRHLFGIQQLGSISEEFQDRFIQLEAINRAIEKRTGEQIPDTHNARLRQTVFDGRTASRLEKLIAEEVDPLTAEMKILGISVDDLGTYLLAKHAPERNAVMKARDPERFSDGNGSGLYDEAAADLLREFDEKGQTAKLERLAKMVKSMLDKDLALRRYAGLIGESEFRSFRAMYKNYSPLRGFAERDDGEQIGRIGRGFDLRGREVRNALGRMTISENPLVQAIAMRQEGIVRAEKARVARALYQQVQRYPDPGIWEIIGKLPKRKVLDPDTGMARDIVDFGALREAEVIGVKIGGEVQYIRIKDPLLAESLKNMSNQSPALVAQLLSGIRRVTRTWGALQTGANPNFVFPNSQSDFLEGVWTAFNVDGASKVKMVASYAKSYPLALAAAIQSEIGNSALGRGLSKIPVPALKRILARDVDPEDMARLERFVREWEASGGKISFQGFRDLDEITRDINAAMAKDGWRRWATKPWTAVGDVVALVEKVNQPIESAGRLAMYIAARENGFSKDKAAAMSLDSSGNFYRRGRATPSLNAIYAFFNASIQGFEKLVRFSKRPRNWAIFGGLAASGFALTAMNILAWDDDDDPEGRSLFMDIPQFERDRAIIIPYGVEEDAPVVGADGKTRRPKRLKYVSYRIPHNLRPFWVMGTALAEIFLKQTDPDEAALNISRSFLAGSNPFGSENLWNAAAPTILDPAVDLSFNRDWTGKPVHPEEAPWNDGVPQSSQYHPRSTSPAAIWLAQTMNEVTGGDGFESGAIDVYPNDLQYLFDYATGGLGRFFRMSGEAVVDRAAGIETDPGRVPVLRSLV